MAAQPAPGYKTGQYFGGNDSHYGGNVRRYGWQYEVFYPGEFTTRYPQGHRELELQNLDLPDLSIPIEKLSHVTHNREAEAIESLECYNFIAKSKVGKGYILDGSPIGESFKYVGQGREASYEYYQYIQRDEQNPLLPGKYSWWGISTGDWLGRDDSADFRRDYAKIPNNPKAGYLMEPPESRYGNNEFKVDLAHLLQCYQRARGDQGPRIYLKKAGTLRYKKEICFVIVVCSYDDLDMLGQHYAAPDQGAVQGPGDNADLVQDPGAAPAEIPVQFLGPDGSVVVNFNGLINNEGLVDPALDDDVNNHIPEFFPRHFRTDPSWVTLAFGFYFPGDGQITVGEDKMHRDTIGHDFCVKTQPPTPWKCPNDIVPV